MILHSVIKYKSQQGAALLMFMLILVMASSYTLLTKMKASTKPHLRQEATSKVLAEAKQALIGYALTYPENNAGFGPGYLPCPDRNNDGYINAGPCASSTGTTIGRFPWRSLGVREMTDSSGARLWYVLSDNYRNSPKVNDSGGFMNSDNAGQLTLDGTGDIVALIISPGEPVGNQNRDISEIDIPDEIANYLEAGNADITAPLDVSYTTSNAGDFNDKVIAVTRQELMAVIEKRILGEVGTVLSGYIDDYGAYPWLSPFENPQGGDPQITGTATAGSAGFILVDATKDFLTLGLLVGDLVINDTDGSRGTITSVDDATQLTLEQLDFGANNNFNVGDDFTIPRFNGEETIREGLLPYHEANELFKSAFDVEWEATVAKGSSVTVDAVTSTIHDDGMIAATETSTGMVSSTVSVSSSDGSCDWSNETTVDCKGSTTDQLYMTGTASATGAAGAIGATLVDSAKDFINAGVKAGDLVQNYSDTLNIANGTGTIAYNGTADAGSGDGVLIDNSQDFIGLKITADTYTLTNITKNTEEEVDAVNSATQLSFAAGFVFDVGDEYIIEGVAPNTLIDLNKTFITSGITARDHLVTNNVDNTEGIVRAVISENELEIAPLNGVDTDFSNDDNYTIRKIRGSVVTNVNSSNTLTITSTDDNVIEFEDGDTYRIRIATEEKTASAETPTNIANFIVYDSDADFTDVKVGDAVKNQSWDGYGLITATGVDGNGPWFTYTALKGGRYPDIFRTEEYRIFHTYVDKRQYNFELQYAGSAYVPKLTAMPADVVADSSKRRNVCIGYGADCTSAAADETLITNTANPSVMLQDYDVDDNLIGKTELTLPANTEGTIRVTGIQYDLLDTDEIPSWFTANNWHHLVYVAYSSGFAPGSAAACDTDTSNLIPNCLSIDDVDSVTLNNDRQALIILAGEELNTQNRTDGTIDEYYELANNSQSDDVFQEQRKTSSFNDQILILETP